MLHLGALTSSRLDDFSDRVNYDNNIFWGGEAGHFGGEASAPQIP